MNAAQPKEFDKAGFVKAVQEAVAARAPKNLDEADKFGDSGKAEEVKSEVQDQVGAGKDASAKEIADTTAQIPKPAPNTKPVVPLAPDAPPAQPAAPNPAQAAPDRLPPSATDMSAGPEQVDQQMADAQVTEPQLARSNEPTFTDALAEKRGLEQHSTTAPEKLRNSEGEELAQVKQTAATQGAQTMATIAAARVATGRQVGAGKTSTKTSDEEKRTQVTALLQTVFDTTKCDVENILTGLDKKVDEQFTKGEKDARDRFTREHKDGMAVYKKKRYAGPDGWGRWIADRFRPLPKEADRIYEQARDNYLTAINQVITDVAGTVETELRRAKDRITQGRTQLRDAVRKLPEDLRAIGERAAEDFTGKFDDLTDTVNTKGTELVDTLATRYTDAVAEIDKQIAAEKEKNKSWLDKAKDKVGDAVKTTLDLKNMLMGVLRKAVTAIKAIIADPIKFLKNLVDAVGGGLKLFMKNIGKHLQGGLFAWLLGTATTAGLEIPPKFDVAGIVMMLASLVGLTWPNIRARIVRKVPDQAVTAAETAVPLVMQAKKRGFSGLWDDLKTRIGDLKKELIDNLIKYLTPTIIIAGITWILSLLNPASAFVRACKMIIDIVRFIINQGAQIIEFVNSVLDAILAIARGGTGGVPALVERALARSIPVLIGALAAILGIGGVVAKVRQIFHQLTRPVNRAVDWIIDKIIKLIKKLWKKLKNKFGKDKDKVPAGKGKDKMPAGKGIGPVGTTLTWKAHGESHRLWIALQHGRYVAMMASDQHPVSRGINQLRKWAKASKSNDALAEIDKAETAFVNLEKAREQLEAKVKLGAKREALSAELNAIKEAEQPLRDAIAEVQQILWLNGDEVARRAKENWRASPFTTRELGKFLDLKSSPTDLVRAWVDRGILFKIQSKPTLGPISTDPGGANTFDPVTAVIRETSPDNRSKYGYSNPAKTSAVGLVILSKGLRGSIDPLTRKMVLPSANDKRDARYHTTRAHYESVVNPAEYPDFTFPLAILGHAPPGASGHWNAEGHKQEKVKNISWNHDPNNYHGPEHQAESSASGGSAQRYRLPSKGEKSHESWWSH